MASIYICHLCFSVFLIAHCAASSLAAGLYIYTIHATNILRSHLHAYPTTPKMPSFTHIRRHSASTIASISSTFTSFCLPQRSVASSRAASTTKSLPAATSSASRAISHAPMRVVKRQLRVASAKTFSYSGLFLTSFLIASFLPFQLLPTGGKGKVGGRKPDKRSRAQRERANQDPDRHDMDSKSGKHTREATRRIEHH